MRSSLISALGVLLLWGSPSLAPLALAAGGRAPETKLCDDRTNPPKDALTQGGCIAISRAKGNCQGCHYVAGIASGNIAPPLVSLAQRFADKARLRAQIEDPRKFNPKTAMPPYGRHDILSAEEIDKLVEWLLTL